MAIMFKDLNVLDLFSFFSKEKKKRPCGGLINKKVPLTHRHKHKKWHAPAGEPATILSSIQPWL